MPLLINGTQSDDQWSLLNIENLSSNAEEAKLELQNIQRQGSATIYPLALYMANRDVLKDAAQITGLLVIGDDDISELTTVLSEVSLITIDFPVLRDGRGFSIARTIARHGFKGEIRAVGDVGFDRLDYMQRSGFNAYQVSQENFSDDLARAFTEISVNYQVTHTR
ncbi:MAG: DUF934 domain-containing protein [Oceanospirillaceae bacterium]